MTLFWNKRTNILFLVNINDTRAKFSKLYLDIDTPDIWLDSIFTSHWFSHYLRDNVNDVEIVADEI